MTIELNQFVYTLQTNAPDHIGVTWHTLTRRVVDSTDNGLVRLSRAVHATYPSHTPPASLEAVAWELAEDKLLIVNDGQVGTGRTWDPAPELGDAEVIDTEAVTAALLEHRNHVHVSRERPMPAPVLSAEQAYLFHIVEWREVRW